VQVVQRSLSGGFLAQDAALLNANARSMFEEARHHVLGGSPWREPYGAGQPKGAPKPPGSRLWAV